MKIREIGNDTVGRERVGAIGLGLMTFDQTGAPPREQLAVTVCCRKFGSGLSNAPAPAKVVRLSTLL